METHQPPNPAALIERGWSAWKPSEVLTVSAWADAHRRLSTEASAEPGRWDTARAEYQREMMDAITDAECPRAVFITSSQVGKTEILLNTLGKFISTEPGPFLVLQPTLEMASVFSKDRLAPMIRDTPKLSELVSDPRSRDSGNTVLNKSFTGGQVAISGANSPASLASRPIRLLLADEVDRYPLSAGEEGDPLSLAMRRQDNFWNRKTILASTPTMKGSSRIEQAYMESDQRRFHINCPHCAGPHVLSWAMVSWTDNNPLTAKLTCPLCRAAYSGGQKNALLSAGKWIAGAPFRGTAGFHLSALYSPWRRLSEIVEDYLAALPHRERLRAWTNTALGETWRDEGDAVEIAPLQERAEAFDAEVPEGAQLLTLGADVQANRIECEVVGWNVKTEESWGIGYHVMHGDTTGAAVWEALDALLAREYTDAGGTKYRVRLAAIDSGFNTPTVYSFTMPRQGRGVFAVKGSSSKWAQPLTRGRNPRGRSAAIWIVGSDTVKESIFNRLKMEPGDGAREMHYPVGRGYDSVYFEGLTGEEIRVRDKNGFKERYFHLLRRNEPLDCRVYATAALYIWQRNGGRIAPPAALAAPRSTAPSFVHGWK